jgi:hypothetical protein
MERRDSATIADEPVRAVATSLETATAMFAAKAARTTTRRGVRSTAA